MSAAPAVRVRDLRFRYRDGEFALRVPDLAIEDGARVAFIGPSGSGKTTLLHLLAGIRVPDGGDVVVDGTPVTGLGDAARRAFRITRLGLVFQQFELLASLSVLDNILLPYRLSPALTLDRAVRERAADLARRVGIEAALRRRAGRLSAGEKQRVALCRAVLPGPRVILADEPTGSLDPANTRRVLDLLFACADEERATLVVVTHDHGLLDRFDRVIDVAHLQAEGAPA